MRRELRAEWTKARTAPGTAWLLSAIVVLTAAASAAVAATVSCTAGGCDQDVPRLGLAGIQAGQAAVAIMAVFAVTGEYGSGMIATTFAAMPRRGRVLAAKAAVLTGLTLVAGTVAVLASVLAARLILPGNGFTAANGHPPPSLADGPTLGAAAGTVLYLALIALFSLGAATALRDSATAAGVVCGVLYVLPLIPHMLADPGWRRLLWQATPANAGLAIQTTTHLDDLPLGPWEGLGVTAAWAAAALLGAWLLVRTRDVRA